MSIKVKIDDVLFYFSTPKNYQGAKKAAESMDPYLAHLQYASAAIDTANERIIKYRYGNLEDLMDTIFDPQP